MSFPQRHTVTAAVDGSGDFTGFTPTVNGMIYAIEYVKDDYANGVDFTVTTETTTQNLWVESDVNAAKTVAPRQPTHSSVGVALVYEAANEPVSTLIAATNERVKIVVASGGVSKTGTFHVIVI